MTPVGHIEKKTQKLIAGLFRDILGYDCLGNWMLSATTTQSPWRRNSSSLSHSGRDS